MLGGVKYEGVADNGTDLLDFSSTGMLSLRDDWSYQNAPVQRNGGDLLKFYGNETHKIAILVRAENNFVCLNIKFGAEWSGWKKIPTSTI